MTLKTATTLAIVGVSIGLAMTLGSSVIPRLIAGDNSTQSQFAMVFGFYRLIQNVAVEGGLLVFLAVLASKQKGQA